MTIERLEELTNEYLQQMKARVDNNLLDKESKDLALEHERIKREFMNILPSVLEKYSDYFEFNPMREEMDLSSENTVQKIYERIVVIKRDLEEDKEIDEGKQRESQQEQPKEENFRRKSTIQDTLQETFQKVEQEMKKREFNINWNTLKTYCNRIINNHIETIEKNVFQKNQNDTIKEEVERYIEEIKQELRNEKSADMKLEFKDGPICPVVTDTNEFAKINMQISEEIEEKGQEDYTKGLPGNVLE